MENVNHTLASLATMEKTAINVKKIGSINIASRVNIQYSIKIMIGHYDIDLATFWISCSNNFHVKKFLDGKCE